MTEKEIITYQAKDGNISFDVNVFEETVWLNQKQLAELYQRDRTVIGRHIANIFEEGELDEKVVCANFALTTQHGAIAGETQDQETKYYNLDVIISVGYRVKSQRGVQFRQWATRVLKQYMLNGYAVNEPRIRKIESSLDELVASHKLLKEDVDGIKNLLLKLVERPIVIHNHNRIGLTSNALENKIIKLLDHITKSLKRESKIKKQIAELKIDAKKLSQDSKARSRLAQFLHDVGDNNSDTHKIIKGAGVAKKVITELAKLGEKIKDLI